MKNKKNATAEKIAESFDLSGKSFLVTGCNSGTGFETMRVLSLRGAKVYGTARTKEKGEVACQKIQGNAIPIVCELSEPKSIKETINSIKEPLHGIIANAGVMAIQEKTTKHGIESHMLINHIVHFILVNGLLDRLSEEGRIVVYSSAAHSYVRGKNVNFDDLSWSRPYSPWSAYGYSKQANILFTKELAKKLKVGQTANSLHPGIVATNLWRHVPEDAGKYKLKTVEQGASTGIYLAVHPEVKNISGEYFSNCKVSAPSKFAQDSELAAQLWQKSEQFAGKY